VVATAGTVSSDAYRAAIAEADSRLTVSQQACPDLVPLVEAGMLSGPPVTAAVGGYLEPLLAEDPAIDTLLLGCTHYPLLRTEFERLTGPGVAVVDSAFTTALALEDLLDVLGNRALAGSQPTHRLTTTGPAPAFAALAERLFDGRVGPVEEVAIRLGG
jgi:glutamate racemase